MASRFPSRLCWARRASRRRGLWTRGLLICARLRAIVGIACLRCAFIRRRGPWVIGWTLGERNWMATCPGLATIPEAIADSTGAASGLRRLDAPFLVVCLGVPWFNEHGDESTGCGGPQEGETGLCQMRLDLAQTSHSTRPLSDNGMSSCPMRISTLDWGIYHPTFHDGQDTQDCTSHETRNALFAAAVVG
jgi:hypothetical protein